MKEAELLEELKGTEIVITYIFHQHIFIDGIFDHVMLNGKILREKELKEIHGMLWEPPQLTKEEMKEALAQ